MISADGRDDVRLKIWNAASVADDNKIVDVRMAGIAIAKLRFMIIENRQEGVLVGLFPEQGWIAAIGFLCGFVGVNARRNVHQESRCLMQGLKPIELRLEPSQFASAGICRAGRRILIVVRPESGIQNDQFLTGDERMREGIISPGEEIPSRIAIGGDDLPFLRESCKQRLARSGVIRFH